MDYSGPSRGDLADVEALNRAYLRQLGDTGVTLQQFAGDLQKRIERLAPAAINRLASAPFFLFSLREDDSAYWNELLHDRREQDLFAAPRAATGEQAQIITAALAYVWQLSRQNAHTARLVCAAPLDWCERIAERPLVSLLEAASKRTDLITPRWREDPVFWRRLLNGGVSEDEPTRRAAQLAALQSLMTVREAGRNERFRTAACRVRGGIAKTIRE